MAGVTTLSLATSVYIAESSACIGTGLFAVDDLDSGQLICRVSQPLVTSLDAARLVDTCSNCYVWTEGGSTGSRLYVKEGTKVQACAGCKRFRYCSKACQKQAWKRGHKQECKIFSQLGDKKIPNIVLACIVLLIRMKSGVITEQVWLPIMELNAHIDDFKQNGTYDDIEKMALGAQQLSFSSHQLELHIVTGLYARILTNCLTLITPTFDPLGIVMDPLLGRFNHSCDPNAFMVMDGPEVSIRTLKPIKTEEEIYISYIDTTNPYARRQKELKSSWFFTCKCSKCEKGPIQSEDNWAIRAQDMSDEWKQQADSIIAREEYNPGPINYVGNSKDEERVAALQTVVFWMYDEEQKVSDPAEAIDMIKHGMIYCIKTGLWPLYRQPYAALRDDAIVNLLSLGSYEIAWAHCAKRYRYIHPRLYPQAFHPVRVVQTWQMAMLALYLASTQAMVAPQADMALIAYMLIMEVRDASKSSHGEENAFTKSVSAKFDEMTVEFRDKLGAGADAALSDEMPRQRRLLAEMGDRLGE